MHEPTNQQWTLSDLCEALTGNLVALKGSTRQTFSSITTDSRTVAKGEVFVALVGEKFDGHDYALAAEKAGAGALVLNRSVGAACPELIVNDTAEAYGSLARFWRRRLSLPLIAVVGSNGKTTTTQMTGAILSSYAGEEAFCTRGNLNNNVGVPRMLLELTEKTRIAVIEAGMNHAGEMAQLASWIAPTVVVITNAQREHQAYIDGVEGSARENAMALVALPETGCAVLPITDSCYRIWADFARARGCRVLTYSAGVSAADVQAVREGGDLVLTTPLGVTRFHFSMAGEHAVHDAAAAAAASLAAGVPLEDIACGLASFTPLAGRGKIYRFESGALLIDESYNANPDSMRSAIDVLATMPSPRILVAGEMGELGKRSQDFHEEVLRYAKDKGIDALYLTGKAMKDALGAAGAAAHFYLKREDLTRAVQEAIKTPCTVLVKASHYVGLDAVVRAVTTDPKKGN